MSSIGFITARFQCRDFVSEDATNAISLKIFRDATEFSKILQWQTNRPRQNYQLAVIDIATQELIGTAGVLMEGTGGGDAKLILNLAQSSQGRYAAAFEIGYGLISWAFDSLSLTQLSVFIPSENSVSEKLAQYAKFSPVKSKSDANLQVWSLSYGTWADHAENLWKNHGTQNHGIRDQAKLCRKHD
jgi:RimJ/RimL family protein N-acetyltransferase